MPPMLAIPACCMYALQTIMAVPRYFIRVTRGLRPGLSSGHFAQSSMYIKLIFGGLTAGPSWELLL